MKREVVVLLGLAAAVFFFAAGGCTKGTTGVVLPADGRTAVVVPGQQVGLSVNGVGEVRVVPDVVLANVGVEVRAATLSSAHSEAAKKMEAIVAALKKQGVAEKDIKTSRYYVSPQVDYRDNKPLSTSYMVTNMVSVKIRQVAKVGEVLDAGIAAGANRIDNIAFTVDDPKPLQAQARELAMADAKDKAERLAALASVKLGKPFQISESGGEAWLPWEFAGKGGMGLGGAEGPTPISPGETVIRLSVQVSYTIN